MSAESNFDYTIEVEIRASSADVWGALAHDSDEWWPKDARMVDPNATVTLDPRAGGGLIENLDGTGSLLWYTVQMCTVGESLDLAGDLGANWGGPARSLVSIRLETNGDSTKVVFQDALIGNVADKTVQILKEGWTSILADGLKRWIEEADAPTG
ncbi:MAG: hypothetical protein GKS06_06185 [Acidobacteria bacterium]|nr:hypothetical protein [Acidobacteriota bacterium]